MPIIIAETIEFDGSDYCFPLNEVRELIPHLKENDTITFSILEIKNEEGKPINIPRPLKRTTQTISSYYNKILREFVPCLRFAPYQAQQLNIGNNYEVTLLIIQHNYRTTFPLETKYIGRTRELAESINKIGISLLSITQPTLQEAVNYLLEAGIHLKEGKIEYARTAIRNSLDKLRGKFLKSIKVSPGMETQDFPDKLDKLIKGIQGFVSYGGPHPGPAPKATTEMAFNMAAELIKMIARNIEEKVIVISPGETTK